MKTRRELWLTFILIVVLVYAGYIYWPIVQSYLPEQQAPVASKVATSVVAVSAETQSVVASVPVSSPEATKVVAQGALVDPFSLRIKVTQKVVKKSDTAQARTVEAKPLDPQLEGIWVDANMKVAFISEQTLVEGGQIMGWRVAQIQKGFVVLTKGSKQRILKLEGLQ